MDQVRQGFNQLLTQPNKLRCKSDFQNRNTNFRCEGDFFPTEITAFVKNIEEKKLFYIKELLTII